MKLRGFDDYEVTLGDEMRGHRATLGLELPEFARELRITAGTLLAIENADLAGFPNQSVVPGHVRTYARHLGMDPEESYRRFCRETGFSSPCALVPVATTGTAEGPRVAFNSRGGTDLTGSRFAVQPVRRRIDAGALVGTCCSAVVVAGLLGGLAYGAITIAEHVSGFALASGVDAEMAEASPEAGHEPAQPAVSLGKGRPDASVYEEGGPLAVAAVVEAPPKDLPSRDGPIAALDPEDSGLYEMAARFDRRETGRPLPACGAIDEETAAPATADGCAPARQSF